MIRAEGITKFFQTGSGRHYVLRNVSFELGPRAQVGLLGRNGAGKSTLLRLLAGVDAPDRGRIIREGRVSWPIGISNCIQPLMTGLENTRFACRIQGLSYEEMQPIIDFVDSFAELGKYFTMPVRVYSSGMRARLGFAITMAFDFDFYILDEVTATGDKLFKEKALKVFEEKRRRSAFIRASHNVRELLSECESGLVLHQGKLEQFASIEQAVERYFHLIEPAEKSGGAPGRAAEKWRKSRARIQAGQAVVNETGAPCAPARPRRAQQSAGGGRQPAKAEPMVAEPRSPASMPAVVSARVVGAAGEQGGQTPPGAQGSPMPLHRLFGLRPESWSR